MMIEIGEVEEVTITDGDEIRRSATGVGDNLWSIVFTFGSSQFRRSYIKLEPLSKLFNVFYSYIAKVKWSRPILCAKGCTTQSLWRVQIASVSRSRNSKGNRTRHCLHPAHHNTCSLVPSFLHSCIPSFLHSFIPDSSSPSRVPTPRTNLTPIKMPLARKGVSFSAIVPLYAQPDCETYSLSDHFFAIFSVA